MRKHKTWPERTWCAYSEPVISWEYIGFSFYTFLLWFVIPIGAILSGFAAATGYYVGARVFGHRPTSLILWNMIAVSVGIFFLVHYLSYASFEIEGQRIRQYLSFGQYIDVLLRHQSLTFRWRSVQMGSTGELGNWSYGYALLQILGFAVGGFCVFGYLRTLPYCKRCSQYLTRIGSATRYTADADAFISLIKDLAACFSTDELQKAITQHSSFGEGNSRKTSHLRSVLTLRQCKSCGVNWLKIVSQKFTGRGWDDINSFSFGQFHAGDLSLDGKSNFVQSKSVSYASELKTATSVQCWCCKNEIIITTEIRGRKAKCPSCGKRKVMPM
jgi:hypothetical protein